MAEINRQMKNAEIKSRRIEFLFISDRLVLPEKANISKLRIIGNDVTFGRLRVTGKQNKSYFWWPEFFRPIIFNPVSS